MTAEWYFIVGTQRHGPVSDTQLRRMAAGGRLGPLNWVWTDGMAEWVAATEVMGLFPDTGESRPGGSRSGPSEQPAAPANNAPFAGLDDSVTPTSRRGRTKRGNGSASTLPRASAVRVFAAGVVVGVVLLLVGSWLLFSRPAGPGDPKGGTRGRNIAANATHIVTEDACVYAFPMGGLDNNSDLWEYLIPQAIHDPVAGKDAEDPAHVLVLKKGAGLQVLKTDFLTKSHKKVHFVRVCEGKHEGKEGWIADRIVRAGR